MFVIKKANRPFPCPNCKEIILTGFKQCRFCKITLEDRAVIAAADKQEEDNRAWNKTTFAPLPWRLWRSAKKALRPALGKISDKLQDLRGIGLFVVKLLSEPIVIILLLIIGIGSLFYAGLAKTAYSQSLLIEVGSGAIFFLTFQLFLRDKLGRRWILWSSCGSAMMLIVARYTESPYWQSLLIEIGVGLILLAILEMFTKKTLDRIKEEMKNGFFLDFDSDEKTRELIEKYKTEHGVLGLGALRLAEMELRGIPIDAEDIDEWREWTPFASLGAPEDWERELHKPDSSKLEESASVGSQAPTATEDGGDPEC
jgi:hypothetical protein